ncbi:MAG: MYXO-CTERM sorting domain-containing protein [Pseudomonadota bacterium]|nr:MYXO-CTERM sorting domain-containing protein [Pseudomonadota bacterium]
MIAGLLIQLLVPLLVPEAHAIPRETVLDNAARYASHVWASSNDNQYAECTDGDYESDYPPGEYTGLPYDWGGYVTLDEFDEQIDDGYGAGSHSWHGSLSCTTGVDCSGFVSMVWETGHYSTSTFADGPTSEISWSQVERGDAVNDAGSHVVLYTHETDGGWPVFYEAAGSAEKVRLNATGGWSYVEGYQPIRFDNIEDGPSTGTRGEPRAITAFPYSDFRWTAGAASDRIDSYACAPDTDESGPEVLYRFFAATAGTLEVLVSDDVGVDVDVHVLTAAEGDACIGRDDTTLTLEVEPGEVWIAVDTWVGSQEFPGAFILTATFDGRVGEVEVPEDTGDGEVDEPADTDDEPEPTEEDPADQERERDAPRASRLTPEDEPSGCGCAAPAGSAPGALVTLGAAGLLLAARRRRA